MDNRRDIFKTIIDRKGFCLLDGGLATELENEGYDLNHPLWSAKILLEDPNVIKRVHRSYLDHGADSILTASYQLSFPGALAVGIPLEKCRQLLELSTQLALRARKELQSSAIPNDKNEPLVGGSLGPYGAYLADGSEYTGNYNCTMEDLLDFHRLRYELISRQAVDFIAFETIPSITEAKAIRRLVIEGNSKPVMVSLACRSGMELNDGSPIEKVVELFNDADEVMVIGINCTAPEYILELVQRIKPVVINKEIAVYPNSGELFDPVSKSWSDSPCAITLSNLALEWYDAGARIIGGCCRTTPGFIRELSKALLNHVDRM